MGMHMPPENNIILNNKVFLKICASRLMQKLINNFHEITNYFISLVLFVTFAVNFSQLGIRVDGSATCFTSLTPHIQKLEPTRK